MADVKTEDAIKIIREELESAFPNFKQEKEKMDYFLQSIEPEIDRAIATGDLMSLNFLKDRMAGRLARVSLGLIYKERVAVSTITITAIRMLVRIAIGAI